MEDNNQHWSRIIAESVLKRFPAREVYVCAAGITPSWTVHFGNFRDVMTSLAVAKQLQKEGKNVRLIFSWDDFDRFRRVPSGVDDSFKKYIGAPLSSVPDPEGEYNSWAERFEKEFERAMVELEISLEYRYQTKEYKSGRYDQFIIQALNSRQKIAQILLSFMSDKAKREKGIDPKEFIKNYYPISIYSRFSGKDSVKILAYDGRTKIRYQCLKTNRIDEIDITKEHIVKLAWKTDWAMRWMAEGVVFEPGGADHASPGGSYDVSKVIAREVFGIRAPVFAGYQFIGLRGLKGKMSSSKGNAVSPLQLLEIYDPSLLKWMYLRRSPSSVFTLAFDSEIYRQYDEFDSEVERYKQNALNLERRQALELSVEKGKFYKHPIPFRQAVALGQIAQWDQEKTIRLLEKLGVAYDKESVRARLKRARNWLQRYNPEQGFSLLESPNQEYLKKMSPKSIEQIRRLRKKIATGARSVEELKKILYEIPKEPGLDPKKITLSQRAFFKDIYNLLFGKDKGPRLATFLWLADREKILKLLDI
ncbi:MAG TPA: lysine--tRNA ligase [bacterium]|nr:lysine--tRNA ligase [bacterium]